jgi:regulatory protein
LREKGFSETTVEVVIERLSRAGLLDDEAFARFWIDNRGQFKPRGRFALRHELGQKGIDSRIVDTLLEEIDETENAYRAALQRYARWERLDPATRRRKLSDYLRRRGFGYETIRQIWERLNAEQETDTIDGE